VVVREGDTGSIVNAKSYDSQSGFFSPRRAFIGGPQTLGGAERLQKGGGGLG
jgi:hypothetical protein